MDSPKEQQTLSQTVMRAMRLHYFTLKHVVIYVALIAMTKNIAVFMMRLYPENRFLQMAAFGIALLLIVAFFSASLLVTSRAFENEPISFAKGWSVMLRKLPKVYGALILYIGGAVVTFYFGEFLVFSAAKLLDPHSPVHGAAAIIGFALVLVYISMIAFLMPLIITDNMNVYTTFYKCIPLSEKNKFGVFLLYFMLLVFWFLLLPGTKHEAFFTHYNLTVFFDFAVLAVLGPFFLNMLLLILDDSKQQLAADEVEIEGMP